MAKNTTESTALTIRNTEMGLGTYEKPGDALVEGPRPQAPRTLPKLVQLKKPGDYCDGLLVRKGAAVEITRRNPETGADESVPVATWIFELCREPLVEVKLMSNYQLDKELDEHLGKRVRVILNAIVDTRSGNRVKDFFIQVWDDDAELVSESA